MIRSSFAGLGVGEEIRRFPQPIMAIPGERKIMIRGMSSSDRINVSSRIKSDLPLGEGGPQFVRSKGMSPFAGMEILAKRMKQNDLLFESDEEQNEDFVHAEVTSKSLLHIMSDRSGFLRQIDFDLILSSNRALIASALARKAFPPESARNKRRRFKWGVRMKSDG